MKLSEFTNKIPQNTCLLLRKIDQSEEFDVIGQQVSYCRRPRAICHAYNIALEGIMLLHAVQYRALCHPVQYIWHVALVLGNN